MIEATIVAAVIFAGVRAVDQAAADPQVAVKVALITMFGTVAVAMIGGAVAIVQNHQVGRKVTAVKAEVSRNGGHSTKDQVVATAGSTKKIERRLEAGGRRMDSIESDVAEVKGDVGTMKTEMAEVKAGVQMLLHAAGIDPDEHQEH